MAKGKGGRLVVWINLALFALEAAMFLVTLIMASSGLDARPVDYSQAIALDCLGILLSMLMHLSVLRARRFSGTQQRFVVMLLVASLYMLSDAVFWVIDCVPALWRLNVANNIVYCFCPTAMVTIFWYLIDEWTRPLSSSYRLANWTMRIIATADALLCLANFFFPVIFSVSRETGFYVRLPGNSIHVAMNGVLLAICFVRILQNRIRVIDKLILIVYPLAPFLNVLTRIGRTGPNLRSVEVFCSLFFLYTSLYVRREREVGERDRMLTESWLRALQLQINPHFLNNSLSSAAALCEIDPMAAQEMIYNLSEYMRDNFTDIDQPPLVPLKDELNHLERYMSIERVRFPRIALEYDLRATGFELPGMSLQPLVENAIKHGICKRRGSAGTIVVATGETPEEWRVEVRDDGLGFDPKALPDGGEGRHVGIANVRTRVSLLCGGRLEIESAPDRGTTCRIVLPKKRREE